MKPQHMTMINKNIWHKYFSISKHAMVNKTISRHCLFNVPLLVYFTIVLFRWRGRSGPTGSEFTGAYLQIMAALLSQVNSLFPRIPWAGLWIRIRINLSCLIRIQEGKNDYKYRKSKEFSCFEVLDVLLWGLKASPVACASFMEAWG